MDNDTVPTIAGKQTTDISISPVGGSQPTDETEVIRE